ncbi:hypothetical protein UK23_08395 [Lentzea aerocolonigenes]|uniref:Methylamine utilisation protein MauE domain-containing protein n=1 Tax=Lentzea aerocolonigenes TaxID=68170 RepID=A0A0F0H6G6_LENAE|nr:MauE/DoxX family redox-associated membrane protein [Lentzea aerocolonigenes]KJK51100.1 hypothetical protein UK23_08395 [Lentzea aerocolonigenes]
MHYVALACRCLVGLVFLISFSTKVAPSAFRAFAQSLRTMNVLPVPLVRPAAVAVVCVELAVAASLVWTASARAGALLAALLLAAFSVAIVVSSTRNANATCRCFGAGGGRLGVRHVVRNALLFVACLVVSFGSAAPADPEVAVAAAGAGVIAALLVVGMDPVAELFGRSRPAI